MEQTGHKDCFTRMHILVPHSDPRVFNMDRIQSIIDEILAIPRGSISDLRTSCTIATDTYGNIPRSSLTIESHSATANPRTSAQVLPSSLASNGNGVSAGHDIEDRAPSTDVGANPVSRSDDNIPAVPQIGTQSYSSDLLDTRPVSARHNVPSSSHANDQVPSSVTSVRQHKSNRVTKLTTMLPKHQTTAMSRNSPTLYPGSSRVGQRKRVHGTPP
ncbi:hypothetical protein BDV97DRAFT_399228 [Delphinella strobiligena]|nr:hypothetical protein BDV97DRAFT_399228 [Delphinella strobiligena]